MEVLTEPQRVLVRDQGDRPSVSYYRDNLLKGNGCTSKGMELLPGTAYCALMAEQSSLLFFFFFAMSRIETRVLNGMCTGGSD